MKPAARVGDLHVCPMFNGPVPHVGGPILPPGCPTVLIGGMPAARVTDKATCVGPPDVIITGSPTVLIGNLMAARMGDNTAHGGVIVMGCFTVLIGDTPAGVTVVKRGNMFIIVNSINKTMYIVGIQEFTGDGATQAFVDRATTSINNTWSGNTVINGENYKVECMVQGQVRNSSDPANPMANQVDVKQTSDPATVTRQNDPANVDGNNVTHLHSTEDDDGGLTIPHEFGHTMGLPDEYREGPRNPDGTRSIVRTGPDGGLMGYIDPRSKPTNDNYNNLVTGHGVTR